MLQHHERDSPNEGSLTKIKQYNLSRYKIEDTSSDPLEWPELRRETKAEDVLEFEKQQQNLTKPLSLPKREKKTEGDEDDKESENEDD